MLSDRCLSVCLSCPVCNVGVLWPNGLADQGETGRAGRPRRSPHWSDLHQQLCSRWPCRRNYVCQVSKWNFQGLRFCRGSNFPFSYWFLNGPYNSAALLRCLWSLCNTVATELSSCECNGAPCDWTTVIHWRRGCNGAPCVVDDDVRARQQTVRV